MNFDLSLHHARRSLSGALLIAAAVPMFAVSAAAQSLYMPRTIKNAIAKGTRSLDGRPGPNYWENHARYSISVTAAPPDRNIAGSEQIAYANNSPDTLRMLVFKLFVNIHKPGAPRDGGAAPDYLTSGVHIDAFAVNGTPTPWQDNPRYFTWQPVRLATPLAPHDTVHLSVNWHYEISKQAGREGMLDSTTYYLAYFYPRIAVYDDDNGWDTMDFTDQQEFYSDFNDYDVTLHVPTNFVVWGTGTLANAAEVLEPAALSRFQASFTSDTTVHVATKADWSARNVTAQEPTNAWHFTAQNVPDMAFAVSDHNDWDAASVLVDDATHRRVSVQAAFNDTAFDFHHLVQFDAHSIGWFSRNWPGVPYPYEKSTIVQGSADMEYPMMVNDGSTADTSFSRFVAAHEIAHTYMPFYMGINETRYGFMDEGWATTFEYLINQADMGPAAAQTLFKQFRVNSWIHDPSPLEDLPIVTPEDVLKGVAYGNNAYGKAALGYLAMKDLLGDATFKKCLQAYMERWHGKHPRPWDFFNTYSDVAGQNLNWFWNNWFFSNNYIDLAVANVTRKGSGYAVTIDNIGGMAAPVDVLLHYADGTTTTVHETPAIWQANQRRTTITVPSAKSIQSLTLDGGIWMDANTLNNSWKAK
ncbi:MAG TPA: M1 family metallopeptidase [Gemmatimonadaceae bacterium]